MQKVALVLWCLCGIAGPAQDPAKTLPRNYQTALENDFVEVVRVRYGPHEKLPVHDHSERPSVYVYLSDSGPVRFSHVEEHSFALTRPPLRAGSFRVSPGRLERHEVENLGSIPTEFLRVELKKIPLGLEDFQFRGNQAFDLTRTAVSDEFSSPQIAIRRFVIAKGTEAQQRQELSTHPVLLIAFSPARIKNGSGRPKVLKHGDLYWLDPNQSIMIEKANDTPAHLLAIAFLT